jgi:hypothetical protein
MRILKHILVVVAFMATLLPCCHAMELHDHDHESAELCAVAAAPCECHPCDHAPCVDEKQIQLDRIGMQDCIEKPTMSVLFIALDKPQPTTYRFTPPDSGILAVLQTIQLLI